MGAVDFPASARSFSYCASSRMMGSRWSPFGTFTARTGLVSTTSSFLDAQARLRGVHARRRYPPWTEMWGAAEDRVLATLTF
ncbi:MAG TPA: hypothetical protein VLA09_05335 [Longimicrobiales bacterium]|nr:hypothetical protein [Longimicrobiales bacterium]